MGAPLFSWGQGIGAFPTHFPKPLEWVPPWTSTTVGVVSPQGNQPHSPGLSQEVDAAPCCQPSPPA